VSHLLDWDAFFAADGMGPQQKRRVDCAGARFRAGKSTNTAGGDRRCTGETEYTRLAPALSALPRLHAGPDRPSPPRSAPLNLMIAVWFTLLALPSTGLRSLASGACLPHEENAPRSPSNLLMRSDPRRFQLSHRPVRSQPFAKPAAASASLNPRRQYNPHNGRLPHALFPGLFNPGPVSAAATQNSLS